MAKVTELPFFGGVDESVDKIFLPVDRLAVVKNCRMTRSGRLEVRPAYTALATTTYSANALTAYDLANYNGRLTALGDQAGLGRATDLFEYVTSAAAWRATSGADVQSSSAPRMPRATDARMIGRIPDLDADAKYTCVAANGGKILMVVQLASTARVHLFDPATDQTLVLTTLPWVHSRATFAGSNLWVVGQAVSGNALLGQRINPSTEEALTQVTLVAAPGGALQDLAAAQTGATDFTIAYTTGTNAIAARFNSAGALQSTWTHATDSIDALAVCGNAGGTRITVMWHDSVSTAFELQTRTQTGGAIIGPTSLFSAETETVIPRVGLAQEGTQICVIGGRTVATGGVTSDNIQTAIVSNEDTHAITATRVYADATMCAAPIGLVSGSRTDFYYGAVDRLADLAGVGTMQLVQQDPQLPQIFLAHALGGSQSTTFNSCGSCCRVGTKIYWGTTNKSIAPRQPDETTFGVSGAVVELELGGTARRQMTQIGTMLGIAGALPLTYEGRYLVEQGFCEKPVCSLVAAGGGGKSAGVYFVATVWEVVDAKGNILRSAPSEFKSVTLAGANTAITVSTSTPHSLRRHPLLQADAGISVRVGFYSTIAGGANLFLESYSTISGGNFADPISATLNAGDNQLQDNPVIYTQAQTPIPHVAPLPYRFAARTRERQFNGGLPATEQWQATKLLFPFEPVENAPPGRLGFTGRANQDVTGVAAIDTSTIVFTLQEIQQVSGRGPEHDGTGDFEAAGPIESPGGCQDWRSILSGPFGVFFQMTPDTLMLIGPGGEKSIGAVSWIGEPVRETLSAYPVITGAVHCRNLMLCAFSCNNSAGTDGVILIYDLARKTWFVDTIGAPVAAISEYLGRLVYVSAGTVFLQDASIALGAAALPSLEVTSGAYRFSGAMGWGLAPKAGVLGTFLGDCTLELFVRYDDQTAFASMGTQALSSATYAVGQAVPLIFTALHECSRFELKCTVTNAANTGAIRLHCFALESQASDGMARLPAFAIR